MECRTLVCILVFIPVMANITSPDDSLISFIFRIITCVYHVCSKIPNFLAFCQYITGAVLKCVSKQNVHHGMRNEDEAHFSFSLLQRLVHTVRFFLNATVFFTCDFLKLFTGCDCDLCVFYESHIAIAQNGCATHSCVMSHTYA